MAIDPITITLGSILGFVGLVYTLKMVIDSKCMKFSFLYGMIQVDEFEMNNKFDIVEDKHKKHHKRSSKID